MIRADGGAFASWSLLRRSFFDENSGRGVDELVGDFVESMLSTREVRVD